MIVRRAMLVAPLALLVRCGSSPPPPPVLMLTIAAGSDQNPDPAGQPAPVAIRIYELASPGAFEQTDVFALIDRQTDTLGADYLGSQEVIVAPGQQQTLIRDLKSNTRFIGAIALFRAIDQATWRVDVPAAPSGPTRMTLATRSVKLFVSTK
jgi:type VI secretion system protein VasD